MYYFILSLSLDSVRVILFEKSNRLARLKRHKLRTGTEVNRAEVKSGKPNKNETFIKLSKNIASIHFMLSYFLTT